jgi:hypothetical protein
MAQSANQTSVIGVITAQQRKLLVDQGSKNGLRERTLILYCGAELGRSSLHRRTKSCSFEWLRVGARLMGLPLNRDQKLSEPAGELKVVKKMYLADCFAARRCEAGKGGNIHERSRVQDRGTRNQARLVCRSFLRSTNRRYTATTVLISVAAGFRCTAR